MIRWDSKMRWTTALAVPVLLFAVVVSSACVMPTTAMACEDGSTMSVSTCWQSPGLQSQPPVIEKVRQTGLAALVAIPALPPIAESPLRIDPAPPPDPGEASLSAPLRL